MDPNANLNRQRDALARLRKMYEDGRNGDPSSREAERDLLVELSVLAEALDGWLVGGGFLPEAWRRHPDVAARIVDHETTAVTIAGVDVHVRDTPGKVVVSVNADNLPLGRGASVESFDGMSWEISLP